MECDKSCEFGGVHEAANQFCASERFVLNGKWLVSLARIALSATEQAISSELGASTPPNSQLLSLFSDFIYAGLSLGLENVKYVTLGKHLFN